MFPTNPINDSIWLPSASTLSSTASNDTTSATLRQVTSNQEEVKKRKGTSILGSLAKKLSRKKSNPPPRISKEEIWKATSENVHPNAARLGMNTFDFSIGSSRDTRNGKILERELSPGAISQRKKSGSPSLVDEDVIPGRSSAKRSTFEEDSESDDDGPRGRHRSGTSAYSDAARKRASGYVARRSSSSSSSSSSSVKSEISYGSAQIAHFTSAYPRQINTRSSNVSDSALRSPISSVGSSMQRSGSSIFDRSSSRWDSTATDVTTPDICNRNSKSILPGKEARGSTFDRCTEPQYSSVIVEEPEELTLLIPDDDAASIGTLEESRPVTPEKQPNPAVAKQYLVEIPPAPFVLSDLQVHQIRVQDFEVGTHEVHNAMDMAVYSPSSHPRKHRKSVFLEMDDGAWTAVPQAEKETLNTNSPDDSTWEETLRHLSITAVSGSAEFYSRNGSMPIPPPPLASVAEEESGSWAFGHKRSVGDVSSEESCLEKCGEFPLHEKASGRSDEASNFRPGHRRSRAVSLGRPRPKTIYVIPERGCSSISTSYEKEDLELDAAVAEECERIDARSSAEFFNIGEGLESVEEEKFVDVME